MEKVCFQLQIKPDRIEEYKERHKKVWPEMLLALSETGWTNYSLFLSEGGMLIGYFETADLDASLSGMAAREINTLWQAEMSEFFLELEGTTPDRGFIQLEEVFNLETQIKSIAQ